MTDEREGAPLWVRALVALMVLITLALMAALAVWAVRLLIEGLVWLISLALGGGVALRLWRWTSTGSCAGTGSRGSGPRTTA